jgi:hypothetical protein
MCHWYVQQGKVNQIFVSMLSIPYFAETGIFRLDGEHLAQCTSRMVMTQLQRLYVASVVAFYVLKTHIY